MPELPDVEVFKRYLEATSLGQRIKQVEVKSEKVLRGVSASQQNRQLRGRRLERARRHGKYLLVELDSDGWLVLHFGMTGFPALLQESDEEPPYRSLGSSRVLPAAASATRSIVPSLRC